MAEFSAFALSLVLAAAFLHAVWNAIIKGAHDSTLALGIISLAHAVIGAVMVVYFLPPLKESWPYIAASTIIHFFYYTFLLTSYRFGDLSHVYPISRGVAPVLVTLGAQFFTGEVLPWAGWLGVIIVSIGVSFPTFFAKRGTKNPKAVWAAIATGCVIASYSVVDGIGVRLSGSPLGYIGWLFMLEFLVAGFIFLLRRNGIRSIQTRIWSVGILGGIFSAAAYGLAIYAKSIAPLGAVSAVRESSVVFAGLIGVIWLKERPWKIRIFSAIIVATGVIILAMSI
jgi:drug/metabolite transporter (DMT)-like permease